MSDRYDRLAAEGVPEETVQQRIKQNRLEMKIGLNWMNKIGILLILFGVGAAFKYSYSAWFTAGMKSAAFFLLGALMLAGGEWLHRTNKRVFALGLLGGSASVWYGSIFYSYFLLDLFSMPVALALSVAVTSLTVLLSLRYRSRTVCVIGLIGGYLPLYSYMLAFGLNGGAVYAAMGYLLLLNLAVLIVSFTQRWMIVNYISFALHIPSMLALVLLSPSEWAGMADSAVTFLLYLTVTLAYPLRKRLKLGVPDLALLALNTIVHCSVMYALFDSLRLDSYKGVLAVCFCALYYALARLVKRTMPKEQTTRYLFYATSLAFAVLFVPFQLDDHYLSLGWLAEALALLGFGHRKSLRFLELAGWGLLLVCLAVFFVIDFGIRHLLIGHSPYFDFRYTSIIVGMLLTTLLYAVWPKPSGREMHRVFKYVTLVHSWIYLLYESHRLFNVLVPGVFSERTFYQWMLSALVTMGCAAVITKVRVWADDGVRLIATLLYTVGCLLGLVITVGLPVLEAGPAAGTSAEYMAVGFLIAFHVLIFIIGRDLLTALIRKYNATMEYVPLVLALYLIGVMTAFLTVQFRMGGIGLAFSFVYLLLAVAYIGYGFRQRFVYIRRLGLGLTLLATGKMVLYDLSFATSGGKIAAYFFFGMLLLGISYMYQKISSKLEEPEQSREQ